MTFVTRKLRITEGSKQIEMSVDLHMPTPYLGTLWRCDVDIHWPEGKESTHGAGIDAVQALTTAMQMTAVCLYVSRYHAEGRLAWGEEGERGYGFALPKAMRDDAVGYDRTF